MKKSLILVAVITLLVALSSVALAQNNKKKTSKTPSAKATGAKTASKSTKTANQSGGDDPEVNTQLSSKANNSTAPTKTESLSQGTFDPGVKKTTDFQTTSEDLQSLKGTKTTNLSGDDDIGVNPKANRKPTNGYAEYEEFAGKPNAKSAKKKSSNLAKKQIRKSGKTNGIEMTPCDVQGKSGKIGDCEKVNEENTQRSSKATGNKAIPKQNSSFMDYTDDAAVKSPENNKKNTDFQTTSEDLQSVKTAKPKTNPKSNNTTSRKRKVNGVYEEDEQKTPTIRKSTKTAPKKP